MPSPFKELVVDLMLMLFRADPRGNKSELRIGFGCKTLYLAMSKLSTVWQILA